MAWRDNSHCTVDLLAHDSCLSCCWHRLARINYFSTNLMEHPTWFSTAPTLNSHNATLVDDYIASVYFTAITFGTGLCLGRRV